MTSAVSAAAADAGDAPVDVAVHFARVRPVAALAARLTAAERRRCERFLQEPDRDRFATARALLRTVIGDGRRATAAVEVLKTPAGRPYLEPVVSGAGEPPPHISLSRSGTWAVVATCREALVGVDVEHLSGVDQPGFERLVCTPEEAARLSGLAPPQAAAERLRIWTLKEALLKASGEGLRTDPRSFAAVEGERALAMPGVPHGSAAVAVAVYGARIGAVSTQEVRL